MVRAASAPPRKPPAGRAPRGLMLLASRSPRRRSLLEQAGIPHVALDPGVDDGSLRSGQVPPAQWVASLAYLKAAAGLAAHPDDHSIVLGADTVCVADGRILGQPRDRTDAERMLRLFEGRAHDVLTGIALLIPGPDGRTTRHLFTDSAIVHVGPLGADRIDEYLATDLWRGKAGAYNLEERLAAGWPIAFDGDPTTVVGLPMGRLIPRLSRLGVQAAGGRIA